MQKAEKSKIFSRLGWCYFGLMLGTQLLSGALSLLLAAWVPWVTKADYFLWLVSYVPLYGLCAPLFVWAMRRFVPVQAEVVEQRRLTPVELLRCYVLMMGTVYVFNIVSVVITGIISYFKRQQVVNPLEVLTGSSGIWYNVLFGCLIAPIGEELLFRFMPRARIVPQFGERTYLIVTSGIFALYHGNLSQLLYAFAVGWLLGLLYLRTGRIGYSIGLHIVINLTGILLGPWLVQKGIFGLAVMLLFEIACIIGAAVIWAKRGEAARVSRMAAQPMRLVQIMKAPGVLALLALSGVLIALTLLV